MSKSTLLALQIIGAVCTIIGIILIDKAPRWITFTFLFIGITLLWWFGGRYQRFRK